MKLKLFLIGVFAAAVAVACEPNRNVTPPPPTSPLPEYSISVTASEGGSAKATANGIVIIQAVASEMVTLTATANEGYEFAGWTTTTQGLEFGDPVFPITTFTMPARAVAIHAEFEQPGVLINGVRWAESNVAAPRTFAAGPTDAGMFYQWGRATGWSSTDPIKGYDAAGEITGATWDNSDEPGGEWMAANDPCPEGWRLPTAEETGKLCDGTKVTNEVVPASAESPAGRTFTDKATGEAIFLPAAGYRNNVTGLLGGVGVMGAYWTVTAGDAVGYGLYMLFMYNYDASPADNANRANGYSVRCVVK